ncbi:DUF2786 domain-containing protein [Aeromicrobium erythreum]|uniref:Uncharacterized protein n=1 Tax=Aeromicrobium erythreum TaxID=2041 RepID=A0A0U4CVT2_9ACTN|nr:DUF2786 domain-containing protein [Aeromicrobium erythreum]ALX04829.1 hypothetical protein AERYTH_09020 [Aeromicrobium erythreum]
MSDDATLRRVRQLLVLADDPGATPAEAQACRDKAEALMARYGIDAALLAAEGHRTSGVVDAYLRLDGPYLRDKATLAVHVAHALRCQSVLVGGERTTTVHVFGFEADVRGTEILVTSLLLQAAHELARVTVPPGEHTAAFRRSWWQGFAQAVYVRLRSVEDEARADAQAERSQEQPSVELVLADRSAEVESAMHARYGGLRRAPRRRLSGGGLADGYASGRRADLGRGTSLQG